MCAELCNNTNFIQNIIFAVFGAFLGLGLSLLYAFVFRPRIEIVNATIKTTDSIEIKIKNKSKRFNVVNMNVEVTAVTINGEQTNHFNIDKSDFLILPKDESKSGNPHERTFKCDATSRILDSIKLTEKILRVRVHSNHGFSGFGKAIEETFTYNLATQTFVKS
jgi:hypothetical protein